MGSITTSKNGILSASEGSVSITVNNEIQELQIGEVVLAGAIVSSDLGFVITFDDGTIFNSDVLPDDESLTDVINTADIATIDQVVDQEALDEITALQDLIASGEDPTKDLPETAAGTPTASQGDSGYVAVTRDADETLADAGYDTTGQTATQTAVIQEESIGENDTPSVLVNDSNIIAEDTVATGNVLDNDSDVDSDLSVVSFDVDDQTYDAGSEVALENGVLILNADGSYTFTPDENWNGQVPVITYTTNTGITATLTIEVTPLDDASVLVNDSNIIVEDTVATGNVLDNDTDVDSDLSVVSFDVDGQTYDAGSEVALENGVLILNADGSYTFTPDENWNGQVPVITYTTNTGITATLTIEVTPLDDASVLVNDSNIIVEDTVATGNVLDNDTDVDSDLSVVSFDVDGQTYDAGSEVALENGVLILNADGSYTFTPDENWNGQVPVITYTTNTGITATLTIEVTPLDDASVLVNDSNIIVEDTVATGNVLDNDTDVDSDLSVVSFDVDGQTYDAGSEVALENGVLILNADGSYTFTPNENWNGQVPVITYTTNTGITATLTIEVTPLADGAPTVIINTDINDDGLISNDEQDGATEVNVTIGLDDTGAQAGDTLIVNGIEIILTQDDIDTGSVNLDLPAPNEGEEIEVVAVVVDSNGNTSPEGTDSAILDTTPPVITVDAPALTNDSTPTITGTTDSPVGSTITLTITDSEGNEQTITTTVNPDGTYEVDVIDPLSEGDYTVIAEVTDPAGNTATDTDNGVVDATAGNITVDLVLNNSSETAVISGTTTDVPPGSTVTLVLIDVNGNQVIVPNVTVDADGNYNIEGVDISTLVDGDITVSATATDNNGNTLNGTDVDNLDATAGNLTVDLVLDNANDQADITGTSQDIPTGGTVDLVLTDVDGNTIEINDVAVNADGSYSVDNVDISALVDGEITVDATATDSNNNPLTADDAEELDATAGNLTVDLVLDNANDQADITGTSQDIPTGGTVDLVLTDVDGNTIEINDVAVNADGSYSVDNVDISALVDGEITVDASASDSNGNPLTADDAEELDATAGNLTVDLVLDNANDQADITGTSQDIPTGGTVDLVLTDVDGNTIEINDVAVNADGSYSVDNVDISALVDGEITVDATATDSNNNPLTADDAEELDATAGNLTVDLVLDNANDQADITGTSQDIPTGGTVDLVLTDVDGNTIEINDVAVNADGSYSVDNVDISALVDGEITVDASASDSNGNPLTADDAEELDATAGNLTVDLVLDNANDQADITGTSQDIPTGGTVDLVLTDVDGNTIEINDVAVNADGSYSVDNVDISALVDGEITVDATATDSNNNPLTADDAEELDATAGNLTVDLVLDNANDQADITGTSQDIPTGGTVDLVLTDVDGNTIEINDVAVNADGSYSVDNVDISALVDGEITVDATATDSNNNPLTADDAEELDATAGNLTVDLVLDNANDQADITGTSQDIPTAARLI
ncbi:S-layer family protein [Shewanella sp. MEBiC00475]|uniref:beta strand repeat-containing protein n=1 Tax=Shewanella sp. MEBiC00475 TaxID=2575361 RepID=UPI0010C135EC|nr:Ig-like domain-containing protein [Shewanella sp. MEBiC00475]